MATISVRGPALSGNTITAGKSITASWSGLPYNTTKITITQFVTTETAGDNIRVLDLGTSSTNDNATFTVENFRSLYTEIYFRLVALNGSGQMVATANTATFNFSQTKPKPSNPSSLTTSPSGSVSGGSTIRLSWTAGSDPSGYSLTYRLSAEYVRIDGNSETVSLYTGSSLNYSYTIPSNKYKSVKYRIDCTNSDGQVSNGYTYSGNVTIVNNRPPTSPSSVSVNIIKQFQD